MTQEQTAGLYGEMQSEKLASDNKIAHQIVSEINQFGINDRQRWMIIYKLSLELENVQEMKDLANFIKDKKGNELFISKIYGADDTEKDEI
jgi:hypothetical protein